MANRLTGTWNNFSVEVGPSDDGSEVWISNRDSGERLYHAPIAVLQSARRGPDGSLRWERQVVQLDSGQEMPAWISYDPTGSLVTWSETRDGGERLDVLGWEEAVIEADARRAVGVQRRAAREKETRRELSRAWRRADNLAVFAWIFGVIALLNIVGLVIGVLTARHSLDGPEVFIMVGSAVGGALLFGALSAFFAGMSSLVELSARRLQQGEPLP